LLTKERIFVVACSLIFAALAQAEDAVVKGELTFDSAGIGQVIECDTRQVIEFGTMASSSYSELKKKYEELAGDGTKAVLVEAEGRLSASSTGKWVLENLRVIGLKSAACGAV
jgi:hypothetical protein